MAMYLKGLILAGICVFTDMAGHVIVAHGQEAARPEPPTPQRTGKYYSDATQLARVLGKAHAIRVACNGRSDQFWRLYMQEMLDLEAPVQGGFRDSMARAFNDSYAAESSVRGWCTKETVAAEAVYAAEGKAIAERLAQFYFKRQ